MHLLVHACMHVREEGMYTPSQLSSQMNYQYVAYKDKNCILFMLILCSALGAATYQNGNTISRTITEVKQC